VVAIKEVINKDHLVETVLVDSKEVANLVVTVSQLLYLSVTLVSEPMMVALQTISPNADPLRQLELPWEKTVDPKVLPMLNLKVTNLLKQHLT
jgi:hypothetical protein